MGGVLVLLAAATVIIRALRARNDSGLNTAILETFRMRVHAWWVLCSILAATFFIGQTATVVLSGLGAFWALREFITLTPTRPGDHRTLFIVFFVITPLQFVLVGMENYPLYSIVIPVYAFLDHSRLDRHGGRLQAIPGTDGEDRGRAADLRLLPELRPGPLDAATRRCPGPRSRPGPTPGCCSSSCSWSSSATPCNTPGPRSPAGT